MLGLTPVSSLIAQDRQSFQWAMQRKTTPRTRSTHNPAKNMGATTASASTAVTTTATAAAQGFANPVSDIAALLSIASNFVGGSPGAQFYHQFEPVCEKAVDAYGPNFVQGAAALNLNPTAVASALSDYLAEGGVNLTPQQLLAAFSPSSSSPIGSVLSSVPTPVLIGGGAVLLLLLLRK